MGRQRIQPTAEPHIVHDAARPGAMILRMSSADQSYVDLSDPLHLEFDYMARMADVLRLWRPAGERIRATHVGGGALTLPRYVAATRPSSSQIVFEPDADVCALVREHMPLPPRSGIKLKQTDGRTGLAALADNSADLVIIDAFVGGRVAPKVTTRECFADVDRVLAEDPLLLLNITDMAPFTFTKAVVAGLLERWPQVLAGALANTWRGRRSGNVVVAASMRELAADHLTRYSSASAFPYRWQPVGGSWCGGVEPLLDDDAIMSPEFEGRLWIL